MESLLVGGDIRGVQYSSAAVTGPARVVLLSMRAESCALKRARLHGRPAWREDVGNLCLHGADQSVVRRVFVSIVEC